MLATYSGATAKERFSEDEAAQGLGVPTATCRARQVGESRGQAWETHDRICKTLGWPQAFASRRATRKRS